MQSQQTTQSQESIQFREILQCQQSFLRKFRDVNSSIQISNETFAKHESMITFSPIDECDSEIYEFKKGGCKVYLGQIFFNHIISLYSFRLALYKEPGLEAALLQRHRDLVMDMIEDFYDEYEEEFLRGKENPDVEGNHDEFFDIIEEMLNQNINQFRPGEFKKCLLADSLKGLVETKLPKQVRFKRNAELTVKDENDSGLRINLPSFNFSRASKTMMWLAMFHQAQEKNESQLNILTCVFLAEMSNLKKLELPLQPLQKEKINQLVEHTWMNLTLEQFERFKKVSRPNYSYFFTAMPRSAMLMVLLLLPYMLLGVGTIFYACAAILSLFVSMMIYSDFIVASCQRSVIDKKSINSVSREDMLEMLFNKYQQETKEIKLENSPQPKSYTIYVYQDIFSASEVSDQTKTTRKIKDEKEKELPESNADRIRRRNQNKPKKEEKEIHWDFIEKKKEKEPISKVFKIRYAENQFGFYTRKAFRDAIGGLSKHMRSSLKKAKAESIRNACFDDKGVRTKFSGPIAGNIGIWGHQVAKQDNAILWCFDNQNEKNTNRHKRYKRK